LLVLRAMVVAMLLATTLLSAAPVSAEPAITTPAPKLILFSTSSNGKVKCPDHVRINFRDEDILAYDPAVAAAGGCGWTKYFDGSDHDLSGADLEDFEILPDGNILFTLDKERDIDQPETCPDGDEIEVDDSDIVLFDFTNECFTIFLEGRDIRLTKGDEDIDAFACEDPDCSGRLLISTIGSAKARGVAGDEVKAKDEDLLACDPVTFECELYFNGSEVGLNSGNEDVDAAWRNYDDGGSLWLTTKGRFFVHSDGSNSLGGDNDDVFGCAPNPAFGEDTNCFFFEVFNGEAATLDENIDGLWATFEDPPFLPLVTVQAASIDTGEAVDADDPFDAEGWAEAMSDPDSEVDAFDFMDVVQQVHIPIVFR
jgi:hypothetical protein